jgi:hypothetical protein
VATILLVVGWFLVISTTKVPLLVEGSADGGATQWAWPEGTFPVPAFFRPELSLVGYAFLGAYASRIPNRRREKDRLRRWPPGQWPHRAGRRRLRDRD